MHLCQRGAGGGELKVQVCRMYVMPTIVTREMVLRQSL